MREEKRREEKRRKYKREKVSFNSLKNLGK
jgi:hypothetical protein